MKIFVSFICVLSLLLSCQKEQIKTDQLDTSIYYDSTPRGQLSNIQLNENEFIKLLSFMYQNYKDDSLKDLTLIEQETTMRIYNTFLAHSGRCEDKHWFYDSEEAENYWMCAFNSNFMEQVEKLHPLDSNQYPISRYHINAMNIALYGPCSDNFMKLCPLIISESDSGSIELRSNL